MFYLACAQLLTGLCFCWVTGGMGVEEVVAESFIEKWMCFILFFRSDAARSCSAIFWLSSSRAGHGLCCHPLGKQVQRILYSYLFLETKNEMKLFFTGRLWGVWGNKSRIVLVHLMRCGLKQWKIQQEKKSTDVSELGYIWARADSFANWFFWTCGGTTGRFVLKE